MGIFLGTELKSLFGGGRCREKRNFYGTLKFLMEMVFNS